MLKNFERAWEHPHHALFVGADLCLGKKELEAETRAKLEKEFLSGCHISCEKHLLVVPPPTILLPQTSQGCLNSGQVASCLQKGINKAADRHHPES